MYDLLMSDVGFGIADVEIRDLEFIKADQIKTNQTSQNQTSEIKKMADVGFDNV
jgi:hypothetical protein